MRGQVKVVQKKIIARRRRRALFISLYVFTAAGLIFCGLGMLSQLDSLNINNVVVEGNKRVSESSVSLQTMEKISGNYLWIFSRSNTLLYPKRSLARDISALPIIKRVDVSRRGLHTLVISITERDENAIWCAGDIGDNSTCYSLDDNGLVFSEGFVDKGFIYRGLIAEEPVGKSFLLASDFKNIEFFIHQLNNLNVSPREALISENAFMTIVLDGGAKFFINTRDDMTVVLSNISTVINNKTLAPSLPEFLKKLDYIKFDSANKVVYKMRNSLSTSTTTTR